MFLGRIDGNVWATIKDEKLKGIRLFIMQPIDENEDPQGAPLIAVDTVGVQEDHHFLDAPLPLPGLLDGGHRRIRGR